MRLFYISRDEVHQELVRALAERRHLRCEIVADADVDAEHRPAIAVYDWDFAPWTIEDTRLSAIVAQARVRPTAVHGYQIDRRTVRKLRHQGVHVLQHLSDRLLGRLLRRLDCERSTRRHPVCRTWPGRSVSSETSHPTFSSRRPCGAKGATAMTTRLNELLQTVQVHNAETAGVLQVFGLRWATEPGPDYLTLDDALAAENLEVTEISEGGSVPVLKVVNKADTHVFLMAGEQLIGAKQNRVLNASILVPAQSTLPIPVSCVEAGRWRYRSEKFQSGGTMSHGKLRKLMSHHTHGSYRAMGIPASNQGAVWNEVGRKLDLLGSISPSAELNQAYTDYSQSLTNMQSTLHAPPDCAGVAFALQGQLVGLDLFDRPETLQKLWPKLLRGYALDALECAELSATPLSADGVGQWLRSAALARPEVFKSPGLGEDVRLESETVLGGCLMVEEHPVHVELFSNN